MTTATTTPIVHGPLVTERLGRVLTVDLCAAHDHMSVAKDSVLPRSSLVVTTAATRMIELSKAGEKLQSIVIVGTSADPHGLRLLLPYVVSDADLDHFLAVFTEVLDA